MLRKHRFLFTQGNAGRDEGGGAGAQPGRRMAGVDQQWGTLEGLRAAGSVGTVV